MPLAVDEDDGAPVGFWFWQRNGEQGNGLILDQKKGGPLVEKLNRERNGVVGCAAIREEEPDF